MKKEVVFDSFFDEIRRKKLESCLPAAAERVTAAGETIRANFPSLTWNNLFVLVLAYEPGARGYLYRLAQQAAADAAGLSCRWEIEDYQPAVVNVILPDTTDHPQLDEETRLNRKLIELQTRQIRAGLWALDGCAFLEDYWRTGVISIDGSGKTQIAEDAAARLDDFCTLTARTERQAAAVAELKLQVESAPDEVTRDRLTGFTLPVRTSPKFYNSTGLTAYTVEDVARVIGCRPYQVAGLQMRVRHPELYRTSIDFRYSSYDFTRLELAFMEG